MTNIAEALGGPRDPNSLPRLESAVFHLGQAAWDFFHHRQSRPRPGEQFARIKSYEASGHLSLPSLHTALKRVKSGRN